MKMKTKEEVLDEYFPKGRSKKRGEAMILMAVTIVETECKILDLIKANTYKDDISIGFEKLTKIIREN